MFVCPRSKEMADLKSERATLCDVIADQKQQLQQLSADNAELNRIISDAYHVIKHNLQVRWLQNDPIVINELTAFRGIRLIPRLHDEA